MVKKCWVDKPFPFVLGDYEDKVLFDVVKDGAVFKVVAWVKSKTCEESFDLDVAGEFPSYRCAMEAGIAAALEWCMKGGVWVPPDMVKEVRAKVPT